MKKSKPIHVTLGEFPLRAAILAATGTLCLTLASPTVAQQAPVGPPTGAPVGDFSHFTKTEQETISAVTKLMEAYSDAYMKGDAAGYANLFTYPTGGAFTGNTRHPVVKSYDEMLRAMTGYFGARNKVLQPASVKISVRPINDIFALGHIRFNYGDHASIQTVEFVSMYIAVKTPEGWRMYIQTNSKDNGQTLQYAGESSREFEWTK